MLRRLLALFLVAMATSLPGASFGEPITLKLSFFTSDRSQIYQNSIKPFVNAVNTEASGLVDIQVYFSGALSRSQADQPKLVADGTAEMALIVPGRTPDEFADTEVMELPGLFSSQLQASLVYTRLLELEALKGYEDFFVVGAFVADGESIHSRKPIRSIDDLKGLTIRVNNPIEAKTVERLGAKPILLAINQTTDAIMQDAIDGATFPPSMLFEFGISRVTNSHYMIQVGGAPTALVMNREKYKSLPPSAQAIIRKYSGAWLAERSAKSFDRTDKQVAAQMAADPRRQVTYPSMEDVKRANRVFASVVADWAAASPHNRDILSLVRSEIARLGEAR
jgi:TRAP-type C4-dicarboxylate transport system substrate-binding protein